MPVPAAPRVERRLDEYELRALRAEFMEARENALRISSIVERYRVEEMAAKQPRVDPREDEYRKYVEKCRLLRENSLYAAAHPQRDDFKAWQQTAEYQARREIRAKLEQKKTDAPAAVDFGKLLNPSPKPEKPKAAPELEDE